MRADVVSFDPGGRTGYAVFAWPKSGLDSQTSFEIVKRGLIQTGEIHSCGCGDPDCDQDKAGLKRLNKLLDKHDPKQIVAEGFSLRPGAMSNKSVLAPVRVLRDLYHLPYPLTIQPPAMKSKATDERLKRSKLWVRGKDARDAVRHLVVWVDQELNAKRKEA